MLQSNRFAETLRSARERQGLPLDEAAAAAGIPLKYVRLLEGDTSLPVGVADELYLVPFLRRYAAFLGLDAADLLPEFLGHIQQVPAEPAPPPRRLSYRSPLAMLWKPAAGAAAVALAAFLMSRGTPQAPPPDDERVGEPARAPEAVATAEPRPQPDAPADAEHRALPAAPAAGTAEDVGTHPATVAEPTPLALEAPAPLAAPAVLAAAEPTVMPSVPPHTAARELRIVVTEETWLQIAVDDRPKENLLLHAGETRSWTAETAFTVTLGNAGGVTLSLDGRELPALGRSGQVVRNLRLPESTPPPDQG